MVFFSPYRTSIAARLFLKHVKQMLNATFLYLDFILQVIQKITVVAIVYVKKVMKQIQTVQETALAVMIIVGLL